MEKQLDNMIALGFVALKVRDINKMRNFYSEVMGMRVIAQTETMTDLGTENRILVRLLHDQVYERPVQPYSGLYHLALLLPSEQALADLLIHIAQRNYPLDGAGDHLYSQAIYLHDPEGNGIEIYADRPRDRWVHLPDGTYASATNEVDIDRLLTHATGSFTELDPNTVMGHVHLQLHDLEAGRAFWQDMMGMDVTAHYGRQAIFYAKNGYHHHIGTNNWAGQNISILPQLVSGLAYLTIMVDNLTDRNLSSEYSRQISEHEVALVEPVNGIHVHLMLQRTERGKTADEGAVD